MAEAEAGRLPWSTLQTEHAYCVSVQRVLFSMLLTVPPLPAWFPASQDAWRDPATAAMIFDALAQWQGQGQGLG